MTSPKRSNIMIALYLSLVFVAGVSVGIFGQRLYASKSVQADSRPATPEQWRAKYVADLKDRLQLTPDQVSKLTVILDETRQKYRDIRERQKPVMKAVHDDQVAQINAMLNASQRAAYAQVLEEKERARALKKQQP